MRHHATAADDLAQQSFVDQLATALDARAHKGVGGAADPKSLFLSQLYQSSAFFKICAERLLRINVLACKQRRTGDLIVLIGACQIEHDVDLGIGKKLIHCIVNTGYVILFLRFFGALADEIAHRQKAHAFEGLFKVFEIDAADVTDTDHSHVHHNRSSLSIHFGHIVKHGRIQVVLDGKLLAIARPKHAALHQHLGGGGIVEHVIVMPE